MPHRLLYDAIADPTRRALLRALRDGSRTAGDLASPFHLSKPTLSHHLKVLRQAGLVRAEKRGTQVFYTLSANVLEELAAELLDIANAAGASVSTSKKGSS